MKSSKVVIQLLGYPLKCLNSRVDSCHCGYMIECGYEYWSTRNTRRAEASRKFPIQAYYGPTHPHCYVARLQNFTMNKGFHPSRRSLFLFVPADYTSLPPPTYSKSRYSIYQKWTLATADSHLRRPSISQILNNLRMIDSIDKPARRVASNKCK